MKSQKMGVSEDKVQFGEMEMRDVGLVSHNPKDIPLIDQLSTDQGKKTNKGHVTLMVQYQGLSTRPSSRLEVNVEVAGAQGKMLM